MKVFIALALTLGTKLFLVQGSNLVCTTNEADIIFVLDGSGSVKAPNFALQQEFAANVSEAFTMENGHTRFGAVIYSTKASQLFPLDKFSTHQEVSEALLAGPYPAKMTNTHLGLQMAERMFGIARPTATKVAIVITDGASTNKSLTPQAATDLKNSGVESLAIGVAKALRSELLDIASKTDYVFEVNSYEVINTLENNVIGKTCKATGGTAHPPCNGTLLGQQCSTFNTDKKTLAEAAKYCEEQGKSLLDVRTEESYKALGQIAAAKNEKMWAGAERAADEKWKLVSDNTYITVPQKWFNWGEPNDWLGQEDCLQMQPNTKLNDACCDNKFAFVCIG